MSHVDTFHFTSKQEQLICTILKLNPNGTFTDIDQILERLPYKTSKQSLQFSLRALAKHGLMEKKPSDVRRGRRRVVWGPTALGMSVCQFLPTEIDETPNLGFGTASP